MKFKLGYYYKSKYNPDYNKKWFIWRKCVEIKNNRGRLEDTDEFFFPTTIFIESKINPDIKRKLRMILCGK